MINKSLLLNKNNLLALLSSFLLWLAWPPMQFTTPIICIALVPLLMALENIYLNEKSKKFKKIFFTSFFSFVAWNTASIYWVFNAVNAYNEGIIGAAISLLVCLIPFCLGPILLSIAIWAFYKTRTNLNVYVRFIALFSFFIAAEYLQQTWDLAFPWMTLGNALAGMPIIAQWYENTGVYGGTLWILACNLIALYAWRNFFLYKGYLKYRISLLFAIIFIIPVTLSVLKYNKYVEAVNPSNIVIVQPNIDPYAKYGSLSAREQMDILTHLSDSIAQPNTEYFIWPETAIPNYANEDRIWDNYDYESLQKFISKYKNGTLITGIETIKVYDTAKTASAKFDSNSNQYIDNYNAAIQIENSANVQFYHKSKLVPGVEKLPFPIISNVLKPVFAKLGGTVGGWGWQDTPSVFYAQSGIGVAPVICYESLWGDWIGKSVKDGAQFIAIITNDGWWGNTSGKDQHLLYAKLRAIETRRYVARSANTGISAVINQRGDVIKETAWWTKDALKADINLNSDLTFYVKSGDFIAKFACFFTVLIAAFGMYKSRKLKQKVD